MIVPHPKDAKHKNQMLRLLRAILSNPILSNNLYFKGGTFASLIAVLDRFSVDLDFDLLDKSKKEIIKKECYKIFEDLDLEVKDESQNHLQFFLKYKAKQNERNTLKLEINDEINPKNQYEKQYLFEINMYCNAQSLPTMFANKLIASKDRYEKNGKIAGRDFYDIHKFFLEGIKVNQEVITAKTGDSYKDYLLQLVDFIKVNVTEKDLLQDLNPLLPSKNIKFVQNQLKQELLILLKDEVERVK